MASKRIYPLVLTIVLVLVFFLFYPAGAYGGYDPSAQRIALFYDEARTVYLGNLARRDNGVPPLRWNIQLTHASRWFSWDSTENRPSGFCGHQDTLGGWPGDRALAFGYLGGAGAENAFCGYVSPEYAINGWMNSSGHRSNLLSPDHREIGLGYYRRDSDGRGYVAQMFGNDAVYAPVIIEYEATSTSSPNVNLYIYDRSTSGGFTGFGAATQMMVSNDPSFSGAVWEPYGANKTWSLESGAGWREVYVKTRDVFNRTMTVSDGIYLGENFPIEQIAAAQLSATRPNVTLFNLNTGTFPQVQFSLGWLADDTFGTFNKWWGNGERVNDPAAWGDTSYRLYPGDGESFAWVYDTGFIKNTPMVAYFRLKVNNNTSGSEVARISIKGGGTEYGPISLRGTDFAAPNQYQEFALPFTFNNNPNDVFLIFQIWRSGNADVFVDAVSIFSAPQPVASPLTWAVPGGNYRGQGVWVRYTNGSQFSSIFEADTYQTFTISGHVAVPGTTLLYNNGTPKSVIADSNGDYTLTVPYGWSGTVTPQKTGFSFMPASRGYANVTSNLSDQDFSQTLPAEWAGGLSLTSDQPVVAVARPHVGAEVMTYNGFGNGSTTMYVPMLFKNAFGGDYKAALYLQNVSDSSSANVSISYYDSTGALTCTVTGETLTPLASKGYWLPTIGCLPSGWVGGAVVTSDQPVVAVGRPHIGSQVTTYAGFGSGSLSMYAPMLFKNAFGGNYNAALYIQNADPALSATVAIDFYDSNGSLACALTGETIAPLATKGYWTPGVSCLPVGWVGGAVITSDRPIVAVARPHISSQVTTYTGFSAGSPSLRAPMLFKNAFAGGRYNAALYIQNTDPSLSATVAIYFYDSNGSLTCSLTGETIAALATQGYWTPAIACLPPGWVGGAVITANRNVVAVGRPHVDAEVATYGGFTAGSTGMYLPMLFKDAFGGSYDSAFYLQNTSGDSPANVTFKFYDTLGNLSCLKQASIPAEATVGYWLPTLTCTP